MLTCSVCQASNPDDHRFCGYCGSPLTAAAEAAPSLPAWLDAPATHSHDAEDGGLPAWLRDDDAPTTSALPVAGSGQPSVSPAVYDAPDADETLPWMRPNADQTPSDDWATPPWLQDEIASEPTHGEGNGAPSPVEQHVAADDALPPWLHEVDATTSDQRPTPPGGSPVAALRTDLGAASTVDAAPSHDDTMDWLYATPAASAPESDAAAPADDLPDWLRDTNAPVAASTTTEADDALPAWLRDDVPGTAATTDAADDLPDWLRAPAATDTPPTDTPLTVPDESRPEQPAAAADDLPAWLRGETTPSTTPDAAPPVDTAQPAAPMPAIEAVPATPAAAAAPAVAAAQPTPPPADRSADTPVDPAALPAWLRADLSTLPAEQPAPTPAMPAAQAALPAWLRDEPETPLPVAEAGEQPAARVYEAPAEPAAQPTSEQAQVPVQVREPTAAPAAPVVPPAPERPVPVAASPRRGRGTNVWITLVILLLVILLLAVGWLALRFNGIV